MDAYLDIETTGLSPVMHKITVVGISLGGDDQVTQWVGRNITAYGLQKALTAATTIYTYNGTRFDLPFLRNQLGIDLMKNFNHRDLMLDCWQANLFGGLKAVERKLGICRQLESVDGLEAIRLWNRYEKLGDHGALRTLLDYNKEDILNLRTLKGALENLCGSANNNARWAK